MANINLISARRAERVRHAKIAKGLVGLLGGSVVAGICGLGFMTMQLVGAQHQIAEYDKKLEGLKPVLAEIQAAEAERKVLQPKLITLTDAQGRTTRWFDIMEGLKRAVPQQTWLTNVSVEKVGDTNQVMKINGITVNQSRVGETMMRLGDQADYYKKVDLRYTQVTRGELGENVEFELAAELQSMDLPQPQEVANATQSK